MVQTAVGMTIPFAGWIADVRFGWYKVICWSISLVWTSSILLSARLAVKQLVDSQNESKDIWHILFLVLILPLGIGYRGFQANMIQFGVDQLTDASSDEITSFVTWYSWAYFGSMLTISFTVFCTNTEYKLLGPLLVCVSLTLVVSSNFFLLGMC